MFAKKMLVAVQSSSDTEVPGSFIPGVSSHKGNSQQATEEITERVPRATLPPLLGAELDI